MSEENAPIEWYLARDGQPHGPLSDAELTKFRELGHLRSDDLVWRAGFPEWRVANEVFPETASPLSLEAEPEAVVESLPEEAPASEAPMAQDQGTLEPEQPETEALEMAAQDRSDPQRTWQLPVENEPSEAKDFGETAAFEKQDKLASLTDRRPSPAATQVHAREAVFQPEQPAPAAQSASFQPTAQAPAAQPRAPQHGGPQQPHPDTHNHIHTVQHQFHAPLGAGKRHEQTGFPIEPQQMGAMPADAGRNRGNRQPHPEQRFFQPGQQIPGQQVSGQQPHGFAQHSFNPHQPMKPQAGFQYSTARGQSNQSAQQARPAQSDRQKIQQPLEEDDFYDDYDEQSRTRSNVIIAAIFALFVFATSLVTWLIYTNSNLIDQIIKDFSDNSARQSANLSTVPSPAERDTLSAGSASADFLTNGFTSATGQKLALLESNFWRELRSQDAEWADRQEKAIDRLTQQGKPVGERLTFAVSAIADWRRSHADKILTSTPEQLRQLAHSFVINLKHLANQDAKACYAFISEGELSPVILPLYNDPKHLDVLAKQIEAFASAARQPNGNSTQYREPRPDDFEALGEMLLKRGWVAEDLEMFSDPAALSAAPESKVCKLVTEWFDTQLQMPPDDRQMRLLATSLQPVVRS